MVKNPLVNNINDFHQIFFQKNKTNNSESTAWYAVAAKNDYDYYSNYLSGFLEFLNKSFY